MIISFQSHRCLNQKTNKNIKKKHQKTTPLFIPGRTHAFLSACQFAEKNAEDFRCFLTSEPPGAMQGKLWDLIPEPILQRFGALVGLVGFSPPFSSTLPETNISPENRPLEKEIPIGNHHF